MRKTTTEWFLIEFKKQIRFEPNSELDIWIKDLIKKAKKREKRQILNIFKDACLHRERYMSMDRSIEIITLKNTQMKFRIILKNLINKK